MKNSKSAAFTLIELLVVISIIAILAGIALPVFGEVKVRGDQTKALSNAKQIGTACKIYAVDYQGTYPQYTDLTEKTAATVSTKSNEILQTLLPDYLPEKSIFAIPKSKYCKNAGSATASTATNLNILGSGENEWAYVCGLTDTSYARWPLLANGFAAGGTATGGNAYSVNESEVGGIWKGKKAIVIRADGSGSVETLKKSDRTVKRNPDAPDGTANNDAFKSGATDTPPWFDGTNSFVTQAWPPQ